MQRGMCFRGRNWLVAVLSCFFVVGLSSCGGGGGGGGDSGTPQMAITPQDGGDSMANAVDITGRERIEGQLDSADDVDYYELQFDEPTEIILWMESEEVEFEILDEEGNVLVSSLRNVGGGGSGLVADSVATPQVAPLVACAVNVVCRSIVVAAGRQIFVRVIKKRALPALAKGGRYVLRHVKRRASAAFRQVKNFLKKNVEAGRLEDINLDTYYSREGDVVVTYSTPLTAVNVGPFKVGIQISGSNLRLSPTSSSECRGRVANQDVKIEVVATATGIPLWEGLPASIRESLAELAGTVSSVSFLERTLIDNGPRLSGTPLTLTVAKGSNKTIDLSDHIDGARTFASATVPAGLGVTQDGSNLTVAASASATSGTVTVRATDSNDVCRTFPLQVTVTGETPTDPESTPPTGETPPTGGTPVACLAGSSGGTVQVCNEIYPGGRTYQANYPDCWPEQGYRRVSQCPRSSSTWRIITSCRVNSAGSNYEGFIYNLPPANIPSFVSGLRNTCESGGGTFTVHKQ